MIFLLFILTVWIRVSRELAGCKIPPLHSLSSLIQEIKAVAQENNNNGATGIEPPSRGNLLLMSSFESKDK